MLGVLGHDGPWGLIHLGSPNYRAVGRDMPRGLALSGAPRREEHCELLPLGALRSKGAKGLHRHVPQGTRGLEGLCLYVTRCSLEDLV